MSWVTDIVLLVGLVEKMDDNFDEVESEAINNINAWLEERELGKLDELSEHVHSGGKAMQCILYGGAFNFMKVDEFIPLVLSQNWKKPQSIMLLTKDETEESFTTHQVV